MNEEQAIEFLQNGGIGVLPTDTLYGLVASAFNSDAVDRIYKTKQRDPEKPLIVLISDITQVEEFGVVLTLALRTQLENYWPGAYSIILPTIDEQFEYLSRGTDAIAFRLPESELVQNIIRETGPLVAPSANPEGYPPATSLDEAEKYFGSSIDFYLDGGVLDGKPSTLLRIENGEVEVLRD